MACTEKMCTYQSGGRSDGATSQGTREERGGLPSGASGECVLLAFQPRKRDFDICLPRTVKEQIFLVLSYQV